MTWKGYGKAEELSASETDELPQLCYSLHPPRVRTVTNGRVKIHLRTARTCAKACSWATAEPFWTQNALAQ